MVQTEPIPPDVEIIETWSHRRSVVGAVDTEGNVYFGVDDVVYPVGNRRVDGYDRERMLVGQPIELDRILMELGEAARRTRIPETVVIDGHTFNSSASSTMDWQLQEPDDPPSEQYRLNFNAAWLHSTIENARRVIRNED